MLQIAAERARQGERERERERESAHARTTNSGNCCCIGLLTRALFIIILTKHKCIHDHLDCKHTHNDERWGAGVETQKNVRGEIGGWGRVPFNEPYAPSLSTIYDGA